MARSAKRKKLAPIDRWFDAALCLFGGAFVVYGFVATFDLVPKPSPDLTATLAIFAYGLALISLSRE